MNPIQAEQAKAAQAPAEEQETQEAQPQQGGDEEVTPEEQEVFKKVEMMMMDALYDKKINEQVLQSLKRGGGPESLANAAMMLFLGIDEKLGNIPLTVVVPAAVNALDQIIELAEEAKIMQVDEQMLGAAVQYLIKMIAEKYEVDPEELQQLIAENEQNVQQIVQQQESYAGGAPGRPGGGPQQQPQGAMNG